MEGVPGRLPFLPSRDDYPLMSTIAPPPKPINPVLVDSEGYIDQQIRRTRRSLKLLDLAAGSITLLIGLLAFVLVGALIDHWIVPGGLGFGGRAALFGLMLAGVAWYGWRQFVPLLKPINPVYAAQTIERNSPTLKNSLLNLLLFRSHRNYLSPRVYHALEQQTAVKMSTSGVDGSIDRSALLRLGYVLLGVIALCALYAVVSPKSLALSTVRVLTPWSDVAAPSRVQILDVTPGKTSVARGERVEVSAEIHGLNADEPVRLRYSTVDGQTVDESIRMKRPAPESRRFEATLPRGAEAGVEQELSYWIEAGDARTRKFKLSVFTRPTIIVQKIRYAYPPYTGLPSKETDHISDIRAVEGTTVTISALANQPIKNAHIDFDADGSNDVPLSFDGDQATSKPFQLKLRDDRRTPLHPKYALRFTAVDGRSNSEPAVHSIEVTPDYGPEVRVTAPEAIEQVARMNDVIPIGVEARDPDYGLKSVTIVGKVLGDDNEHALLQMIDQPQTGRVVATRMFTPADAGLKPGDVLEYWAVAADTKPEPNLALSDRRRLKVIGPDKPQNGKAPQQPNQQPNDQQQEGGDQGESGQGGAGGQGGESSAGGGASDQQSGAGGSSGGQGQPGESGQEGDQGQEGGGASGGNSDASDSAEDSNQAGENGGGSAGGQPADNNQPQAGANGGGGGQNQQPDGGQSPAEQGGESADAGGQDTGEAGGAGGKVSPDGDEDATAIQRMAEHFNKQQQSGGGKPGAQQAGGQQPQGEATPAGEPNNESPAGDSAPSANGQGAKPQPSQGAAGQQDAAQQQPGSDGAQAPEGEPGDDQQLGSGEANGESPAGTPPSNNAAGQGQQGSRQQPPGEGAQPPGTGEQAGDQQQPGGAAGQNPSPRTGANQSRDGQPGDADQQQPQGQQPSPDSAMNDSGGDAGAGHSTGQEQGAPGSDDANRQGTKKNQEDNRPGREDNEAPVGSPDKKESDSQGGVSGEQSGGGQEGGGQQAEAPGKGGPGEHEAADEGGGRASEQGQGESGTQAGDQQQAAGKTGQSSGDQAGNGSNQGDAGEQRDQQPGDQQPGEEGAKSDQQGTAGPPGAAGSPNDQAGGQPSPSGDEQPGGQPSGEPGGQPGEAPNQPSPAGAAPNGNQPDVPPSEQQPPDKQDQPTPSNPTGSASPAGSGTGSNATGSSAESGQLGEDKANLDFARQQTNLVLEGLDQQLAKKQVDQELLKNLGWTEAQLQQFVDRWKNLQTRAAGEGEQATEAQAELDDALRSLGLRQDAPLRFRGKAKADDLRANDALRVKPPSEYADRVREYTKGISTQRKK
jgi:hypothetical protein